MKWPSGCSQPPSLRLSGLHSSPPVLLSFFLVLQLLLQRCYATLADSREAWTHRINSGAERIPVSDVMGLIPKPRSDGGETHTHTHVLFSYFIFLTSSLNLHFSYFPRCRCLITAPNHGTLSPVVLSEASAAQSLRDNCFFSEARFSHVFWKRQHETMSDKPQGWLLPFYFWLLFLCCFSFRSLWL